MAFLLKRVVDLSKLGWEDCSITLRAADWEESDEWSKKFTNPDPHDVKLQDDLFNIIKDHFISGEGLDENGKKIPINKDNLKELPIDIFKACMVSLGGSQPDPN